MLGKKAQTVDMPKAISMDKRKRVWQRKVEGHRTIDIAREFEISPQTVRRIIERGSDRLMPSYDRCGRNGHEHSTEIRDRAIELKRQHPGWGGVVIGLELAKRLAELAELAEQFEGSGSVPVSVRIPATRTLQSWFRKASVNLKRERQPAKIRNKGVIVHEVWELDAKEQVRLGDGSRASAMMAVDEASGALIGAATFPPRAHQLGSADRCARRAA